MIQGVDLVLATSPHTSPTGRRIGICIEPTALTFYDLDTPRVLGTRTNPL
jgi:hypothetical protein